jgi:hypothetical protein
MGEGGLTGVDAFVSMAHVDGQEPRIGALLTHRLARDSKNI